MDDALLVSRAMAGDLDSFGQLYDRYFSQMYDFAWRVVRDPAEAADITQHIFLEAIQRLPSLPSSVGFKAWLFAMAHDAAVTRAELGNRMTPVSGPSHEEAFGSFDVPHASRLDDPALVAGDFEAAALVWEAAAALNARDYALLDLHVRQGLGSAEIATILGVSKGNAATMVSRMKSAAGDVLGSYVIARRDSGDCPELQRVLSGVEFPPYTEPVRKAVDAHIKDCATCQAAKKALVAPLDMLAGFAAVPAPIALKGDLWADLSSAWGRNGRARSAAAAAGTGLPANPYLEAGAIAGAAGGGGGSAPALPIALGGDRWDRNKIALFVGGVIALLVVAFGGGALLVNAFSGGGGDGVAGAAPTATRTPGAVGARSPQGTVTVGVSVQTPTPSLTPTSTPEPTETPTELPPTETPTTPATATPTPRAVATATPPRGTTTTPATDTATPRPGARTATPIP